MSWVLKKASVIRTFRIGFRMVELFREIDEDFGGSISWKYATQLSSLLQFLFVAILFRPITGLFFNPAVCKDAFFLNLRPSLSFRTSTLVNATFQMIKSFDMTLLDFSPLPQFLLFLLILQGIAGEIGVSNFLRAFLMVSWNSLSSG